MMDYREMCRQYLWGHCSLYKHSKESMRVWLLKKVYKTKHDKDSRQHNFFMTCLNIMENAREWNEIFTYGKGR